MKNQNFEEKHKFLENQILEKYFLKKRNFRKINFFISFFLKFQNTARPLLRAPGMPHWDHKEADVHLQAAEPDTSSSSTYQQDW